MPVHAAPNAAAPPRFDFGDADRAVAALDSPDAPSRCDLRVPDTHGAFSRRRDLPRTRQSWTRIGDLRPLGQIHDSFIIAAGRDGLWIIDQHVAHERILFEQVLAQQAAGRVEVQHLLMPRDSAADAGAADRIRAHRR